MVLGLLWEILTLGERTGLEYAMELRNAGYSIDVVEQRLKAAGYTVTRERFLDLNALRVLEPGEDLSRYRGNAGELAIWDRPGQTNYQA